MTRRTRIANINVEGQEGKIDLVQDAKDIRRSGNYRVMVKLKGEKEFKLTTIADNVDRKYFKPIIEDQINAEYVTEWSFE